MLVGPVAKQGTAGVGQRLGIDFPCRGAPADQPLLAGHPGVQGAFDVLRHAGRADALGSGLEPRGDAGIQAYSDPFLPAAHTARL